MAFTSPNIGLRVWDLGTDPYDHAELAANWTKVDLHDHTSGKGVKVPRGGIADDAIGPDQLDEDSVTSAHIVDGTIQGSDIAAGTIGPSQLSSAVRGAVPLGTVIAWYRATGSVALPTGWELCDGRNWSAVTNDLGLSSDSLPDLRNRFVLGAGGSGPAERATGGSHTVGLSHNHTVDSHTHSTSDHVHSIAGDGLHHHQFSSDNTNLVSRTINAATSGTTGSLPEALYLPDHVGETIVMNDRGTHSHGGGTGAAGAGSTGGASPGTTNSLGTVDIRPQFVGLLYIMKVRL